MNCEKTLTMALLVLQVKNVIYKGFSQQSPQPAKGRPGASASVASWVGEALLQNSSNFQKSPKKDYTLTLKSPRTKILPYDKSLVKFGRRYFKDRRKRPGVSQASFFLWLTLPAKTLKDHWPISIAPQHSKVPVPKYPPMTKPLSNLGGGTFKGTIKVKTLTETHSEQKFGASLAT